MDGTGRILVSPELRAAAGIARDALLLGMGNHFELWDKATHDAKEAEAIAGRDARRLPGLLVLRSRRWNTPWTHTTVLLKKRWKPLFRAGARAPAPTWMRPSGAAGTRAPSWRGWRPRAG